MFKAVVVGDDMSGDRKSCSFILSRREHNDALRRSNVGPYAPRDYVSDPQPVAGTTDSYSVGGDQNDSR